LQVLGKPNRNHCYAFAGDTSHAQKEFEIRLKDSRSREQDMPQHSAKRKCLNTAQNGTDWFDKVQRTDHNHAPLMLL